MKKLALVSILGMFVSSLMLGPAWSATEIRMTGMYVSSGLGVTGDHRLGNTCVTSPGGRTYCGLNASHLSFFADNTLSLEKLRWFAAAADNGVNTYCLKSAGDNTFYWGVCGAGGSTTSLPWDNITSRPTINGVPVTGTVLDNILNYPVPVLGTNTNGDYVSGVTASGGLVKTGTEGATVGIRTDCGPDNTIKWSGTAWVCTSFSSAAGDVVGPASATDNAVAIFNGATGKLLKNSPITIGLDNSLNIEQSATQEGYWRGYELSGSGSNYKGWRVPTAITNSTDFRLPDTDPSGNQGLQCGTPAANISTCAWTTYVTSAEPPLGNPGVDNYVLQSSAAGARSWVAQSGGAGIWPTIGAVDNTIPIMDNVTGKLKNSPLTIGNDNILRGLSGIRTTHVDNTAYFGIANSAPPTVTDNGDMYYDNTLKRLRFWQDGAWKQGLDNTDIGTLVLAPTGSGASLSGITASQTGAVPTSTTVNGHALSSNVTVSASDLTTGTVPMAQLGSSGSRDNTTMLRGDGAWVTRTQNWGTSFQSPAATAATTFQFADARVTVDNVFFSFLDNTGKLPGSALDNGTIQILSCSALGTPTCDNVTAATAFDGTAVNYPAIVTAIIPLKNFLVAKITALGRAATYLTVSAGMIVHVTP